MNMLASDPRSYERYLSSSENLALKNASLCRSQANDLCNSGPA